MEGTTTRKLILIIFIKKAISISNSTRIRKNAPLIVKKLQSKPLKNRKKNRLWHIHNGVGRFKFNDLYTQA
jgi:hypothetical protein